MDEYSNDAENTLIHKRNTSQEICTHFRFCCVFYGEVLTQLSHCFTLIPQDFFTGTEAIMWGNHKVAPVPVNTLRPGQDGRRFPDDTLEHIFLKENVRISIKISLNFAPKSPIDNIPALFQKMAWRRSGAKPLYEPMMVRLPTHICVTRPQWVKQPWRLWVNMACSYTPNDDITTLKHSLTKPCAYLIYKWYRWFSARLL